MKKLIPFLVIVFLFLVQNLFSQSAKEYFYTGKTYEELGDYIKAIEYFNKAIEMEPDCPEWKLAAYVLRGDAYTALYEYKKAIKDYNKAITNDPNFTVAYIHRGQTKYLNKDYDGACKDFYKAKEIATENDDYATAQKMINDFCK